MGCAPLGHILYDEFLRFNPKNPYWFNRDRFVLSAGHGCMLQYALLHLAGYDSVREEDLKQFRQWGSRTPGHPENFETPGPLGQGVANAVGLALSERHLAARFNKPDNEIIDHYTADTTRNVSQYCLNALATVLPGFLGGSADLASCNMTLLKRFGDFQKSTPGERNLRFGVREHGMGAICNGIKLHSPGLIPYCATFFVFTDYMRGAIRISALSQAGVIYVMLMIPLVLVKDGPTHQAIEHLMSFRAMPNILMFRPVDGNATAGAYRIAVLNKKRPSILALSRQKLPQLAGTSIEKVEKGGYIVSDNSFDNKPDIILIGTGSELEIAAKAADELRKEGKTVRVVSLVSWELFDEQSDVYKESVFPEDVTARISIEAGATLGWEKFVGRKGKAIGIGRFGASAPAGRLYKEFGLTMGAVIAAAKRL